MAERSGATEGTDKPLVLRRSEHGLSRRNIDPEALKILFRLQRLGFTAYLTGGAVRDMLLGKVPKDFDIATDARPNQIRKHFANAFVIGRRFRLVHVRFHGGKVIEVATFRRDPGSPALEAAEDGAPLHAFGTPAQDAWRRDITVNALFYDPASATVIDYVGGVSDLRQGRIRLIGDAGERFREDPVRVWRVIRYAARLDFAIGEELGFEILRQRHLLAVCPGARLFEEFAKDLLGPRSRDVVSRLSGYGVLSLLLGRIGEAFESDPQMAALLTRLLDIVDGEKAQGRNVGLGEAACLLFWPWAEPLLEQAGPDPFPVMKKAFLDSGMAVALPKGLRAQVIDVLAMVALMRRALKSGAMRWSARNRPCFAPASRLCFIITRERSPEQGETFEALYQEAFPGRPATERARRPRPRRRRRGARPVVQ